MDSERKTILVVEGDQDLREGIKDLLEMEGHRAILVSRYQEALPYLRLANPPKVIIFDCTPPFGDGEQFINELKKNSAVFSAISIFMMFSDNTIQQKFSNSGITGFIKKPLDLDSFLEVLRSPSQLAS